MNKGKLFSTFICLAFIFSSNLIAKDESIFSLYLSNNNNPMGVSMILTDPFGRRTGVNLNSGLRIKEIPNSSGGFSYIANAESGEASSGGSMHIIVSPVSLGSHSLEIFGITDTVYSLLIGRADTSYNRLPKILFKSYITSGTTQQYSIYIDPTPGAPAPVITKVVTFDTLRQDLIVAHKLNQLGDDKFVGSLIRMVNLAEHLADKCKKYEKEKCHPAIAVLNMFVKRLEIANRRCDSKDPKTCDEDKDWDNFGKEHRKDRDYDDFFREWDRDDWHKDKKTCKRFVTDEALKIIKEDAGWLIKSLGGEIDKDHGKDDFDRDNYHSDKEDRKANH